MLLCVCSVIDHRLRQNVVGTKKWHTRRSPVCHWCSYHILRSSVIYCWTDARQHGIDLFYIIKKLKYTEKMPFYFKFPHFDRHENSTDVILFLWRFCTAAMLDGRNNRFFFPWEQIFFLMQIIFIVLPSNMAVVQNLYIKWSELIGC